MGSFKFGHHVALALSAVVLLFVITCAFGASITSSSSSQFSPSTSSSLSSTSSPSSSSPSSPMRSEQRELRQPDNDEFEITPRKKGDGSKLRGGSKRKEGNNRNGGSKRKGGSKKNKRGGGNKSRNKGPRNFTTTCECGKKLTNRIIGGVPTTRNEYPWQAALFKGETFVCGGTLINDRFVLTATHCVETEAPGDVTVRLREHNLDKPDQAKEIEKKVSKIIRHKDYNSDTYPNDITLLELDGEIVFSNVKSLRPICLPSTTTELYVDDKAIATGWGQTDPFNDMLSSVLLEVELKVVSEQDCSKFYNPGVIKKTNICAGNRKKNTCYGDSGGPLAYENSETRYEQIGVTSQGIDCGQTTKAPAVFTRVNKYLRWIKRKTKSATYCTGFTFP